MTSLALILRQRNFALVWWAGLISMTGDWALRIALPIHVLQLTGSALATSAAAIAGMAPVLLVGLIAGVYVDRWDRRTVMAVVSLIQAVTLLPLFAVHSSAELWIVYAVLFMQSAMAQFFMPAENALLPNLVDAGKLPQANALKALNNNIARLGGPALGGLLAAGLGLTGVVIVDTATFLLAAALVALVRGSYKAAAQPAETAPRASLRREFADGLRVALTSPMTRVLLAIAALFSIGEGIMSGLFPLFITGPLHGGARELGWTMSAQAIGGIAGGLAGPIFLSRISATRLAVWGSVLFGLIDLAIFNYPRWTGVLWPGLALFIVVGLPLALLNASFMTLLQRAVDGAYLGRVFSVILVLESTGGVAGAALAGAYGDRWGVINLLTVQGAMPVLCGIGFALAARRLAVAERGARPAVEAQPVAI